MKELWINLLQAVGLAWWVEIFTESPRCTYYFGPFASAGEAESEKSGYIEDLEQEGAQGIKVVVKRCKPDNLTIYEESVDRPSRSDPARVLSGQV